MVRSAERGGRLPHRLFRSRAVPTISEGRYGWIAPAYRFRLSGSIQGGRRGFVPEELLEIERSGGLAEPVPATQPRSVERVPDVEHVADPIADRRVRHELRRQIALLEKRLGELFASAFPRAGIEWSVPAVGGPRVLGVAELERVRDGLAVRLREAQEELGRRGEIEEANRGLLESMIAQPDHYRWVRVAAEDVGERPCQHWHSRPRWGILGMLFGWWRVKHSSGCPLARGLAAPVPSTR